MIQRKRWERIIHPIAQKLIDQRLCPVCGKKNTRQYKTCSPFCNNIFYQEYAVINDWGKLRQDCFRRDGHKCVKCGKESEELIADHIFPIALGGAEFDLNNIQSLCPDCNRVKTREDLNWIGAVRRAGKRLHLDKINAESNDIQTILNI